MKHFEKKIVNHKPQDLFNLVVDIGKYPEFLPWCLGARVKKINENNLNADLIVGFKLYREVFKSNVVINKKQFEVKVEYLQGPFNYLNNFWSFNKINERCEVVFSVDFALNTKILNKVMESFFKDGIKKMVKAFEERADFLYH